MGFIFFSWFCFAFNISLGCLDKSIWWDKEHRILSWVLPRISRATRAFREQCTDCQHCHLRGEKQRREHLLIGWPRQSEPWIFSLSHLISHLCPSNGGMMCKFWGRVGVGLTVLTFNSLLVRIHSRPKCVLVTYRWPLQRAKKRRSRAWKWGKECCFRFLNELMYPYINI